MGTMGRRSGRAAARKAAAALESTPKHFDHFDDDDDDDEDDQMIDADDAAPDPSSPADESINPEANEDEQDDGQDDQGAREESAGQEDEAEAEFKEPSPPPVIMIRKKRLGRPPKNKPPDWDPMIEVPATEADLTPRRRGRGGWRGRGGRRGAPAIPTTQVIDKDGNTAPIENDELGLPEDPEGEKKVDKLGYLKGGREYRCRTFKVQGRGDRIYMLSTEPARCVGFRDSYLFFTKHRKLFKVLVDDEEKRDMIERDIIPHSYKGRSIGIVTARSVFREFGALIIVGGKRIVDDYEVAAAREEGVIEGEIADPNDHFVEGEPYNQNQYVAWFGASAVYHAGGGQAAPVQNGKVDSKKRRVAVNDVNWMLEHARDSSTFNTTLTAARKHNVNGVYDIHTNSIHYPANLQPTRARAVQISPEEEDEAATEDFPPVPAQVSRNFLVHDIHMETPPAGIAQASYQKPYQEEPDNPYSGDFLAPFRGLSAVPDNIKDLLPPECRVAFIEALNKEQEWHGKWGTEKESLARREPVVDKAVVPYSMALPKDHFL